MFAVIARPGSVSCSTALQVSSSEGAIMCPHGHCPVFKKRSPRSQEGVACSCIEQVLLDPQICFATQSLQTWQRASACTPLQLPRLRCTLVLRSLPGSTSSSLDHTTLQIQHLHFCVVYDFVFGPGRLQKTTRDRVTRATWDVVHSLKFACITV